MAASELRRLLYVAATRAGDHLVITSFREPEAGGLLGPLQGLVPAAGTVEAEREEGGARVRLLAAAPPSRPAEGPVEGVAELVRRREQWTSERDELLSRARRPAPVTSPSELERVAGEDDGEAETVVPVGVGRAQALRLGTAVHRVMERVSLDGDDLQSCVEQVVAEERLPSWRRASRSWRRPAWQAEPVRAAAAAAQCYRELPLAFTVEGATVTGAVDLLTATGSHGWSSTTRPTGRPRSSACGTSMSCRAAPTRWASGSRRAPTCVRSCSCWRARRPTADGAAPLLRLPVDERLYDACPGAHPRGGPVRRAAGRTA